MSPLTKHTRYAFVLMLVVLLPILAACAAPGGGTQASPAASPEAATSPAASPEAVASPEASPEASPSPVSEASPEASPATGEAGSYLVFGGSGEVAELDCMNTTAGTDLIACQQIHETLIDFKPGTFELVPQLAESWEANEDSTEWTFKLRQGVTFHDGTPFNAEAVVFNFRRLAEPNFEFGFRDQGKTYPIFPDIFGAYAGEEGSLWKGIEAVDEYTVKISLTQSVPLLPNYLAASYFGIASPEAVRQAGAKYGTPDAGAVGTGPFVFQEWRPGESVTLKRNENYWGEKARMPGVVIRFLADPAQRLTELQAGNVDFTINLAPDARETIENSGDLKLVDLEPFNIAYLSLDMTVKPLDDVRVRRAIAHAIDKQAILDAFYGGVGEVATTFLPPGLAEYRPDNIETYDYNPDRARELLAEAGYPDGFNTMVLSDGTEVPLELWYMPVSRPYYPTPKPIAEAYQAMLADIGINVELKTEDWGVYLDNWDAGKKHGLVMLGWTGDYLDPNNFLFTHFGPGNEAEAGYRNERVWDLLRQAAAASNQEEAKRLFKEAGQLINEDIPRIPIVHSPPVYAARQGVEGWIPNPTGGESFASIFVQK